MNTPQIYFDHEKHVACQRSLEFVVWANQLPENISSKLAVHVTYDPEWNRAKRRPTNCCAMYYVHSRRNMKEREQQLNRLERANVSDSAKDPKA